MVDSVSSVCSCGISSTPPVFCAVALGIVASGGGDACELEHASFDRHPDPVPVRLVRHIRHVVLGAGLLRLAGLADVLAAGRADEPVDRVVGVVGAGGEQGGSYEAAG